MHISQVFLQVLMCSGAVHFCYEYYHVQIQLNVIHFKMSVI